MEAEVNSTETKFEGLRYARWAGQALGAVLILLGLFAPFGGEGGFQVFRNFYFIAYGVVLVVPFDRLPEKFWKPGFVLLSVLSGLFVFVMVAHVMFAYMAAAEIGEKLGVPGLEGTLIFVALMQVPVVLFQRNPDLLE